jgi:GGDEF domain-containing protein
VSAAERHVAAFRHRLRLRHSVRAMTEDHLIDALYRDPATKLLNRRAFEQSRSQMIAIVDLDSLKWVNDNEGHAAGDDLLRAIARELVQAFAEHRVYRLAGDEFVVRGDDAAEITATLRYVRRRFPGFSFGVGRSLDEADEALRFEKQQRERRG